MSSAKPGVPRSALLAVAAIIVLAPAAAALAGGYRTDSQDRVMHRHTASYGVWNNVSNDLQLREGVNQGRFEWHQRLAARDTVRMPNVQTQEESEIIARRQNLGDSEGLVVRANDGHHQSQRATITFNSFRTDNLTGIEKQGLACRNLGIVIGMAPGSSWNDCLNDIGRIRPANPRVDLARDFYGPNLTVSGSLIANRDELSTTRGYRLSATGDGHAIESLRVFVEGDEANPLVDETRTPCDGHCEVGVEDEAIDATELGEGEHTLHVVTENEFGQTRERSYELYISAHTGVLRNYAFESEELTDRSLWRTNVASGNGLLEARDVEVAGTGLDLVVARFWNSLSAREGSFGRGWSMGTGDGVELDELPSGDVRFFGPSGYVVRFGDPQESGSTTTYEDEPAGLDASLTWRDQSETYLLEMLRSEERMIFDSEGRLLRHLDRNDHAIHFDYSGDLLSAITDTQERELELSHYGPGAHEGLIREITDWTGRTWSYEYDAQRRLIAYVDPEAQRTEYDYDSEDRLVMIHDPRSSDDDRTAIAYPSTANRRVASITREAGPQGEGDYTTSFDYDAGPGECDDEDDHNERTVVSDPNSNETDYCHDNRSQVGKVIDARGNETSTSYTSKGNIETYALASGIEHSFTYDGANRLEQTNATGGAQTQISYDGQNESFRPNSIDEGTEDDPAQTQSFFTYDTSGNLETVRGADQNGDPETDPLVEIDRYGDGDDPNLKGLVRFSEDGKGNRTTYDYDDQGNLIAENPPTAAGGATLIGPTEYGYEEPGSTEHLSRVTSVTDGNENEREITYDGLDRPEQIEYLPSDHPVHPSDAVRYEYDGAGNLRWRSDGDHSEGTSDNRDEFRYDGRNLRTSDLLRGSRNVHYTYDDAGNLTELEHVGPQGQGYGTTTYAYNAVNLVTEITEPGATQSFGFEYNDDNQPTEITFPNGLTQTNDYCHERLVGSEVTDASSTVSNLRYRWDPARSGEQCDESRDDLGARLTRLNDTELGIRTDYDYDGLGRLEQAEETQVFGSEPARTYEYDYDRASNVTERTINPAAGQPQSTLYDYNNANQLIEVGSSELDWDQNGNLLEDQDGQAFDYDRRSLTREIDPDGGPAIDLGYSDDTQRERITKAETTYTDDLLGTAVEDPGSSAPTFYVRHPDTGEALGMRNSAGSFYFVSDMLGSVRAITDSQGELLRRYRYEPYGQASGQVDPPGAPQAPANPIRFQGQYLDSETGLYKMGMRYMDPEVGRWTQRDPLNLVRDPRQGNRYGFASGNPVNITDPSGAVSICHEGSWFPDICDVLGPVGDRASDALGTAAEETQQAAIGCAVGVVAWNRGPSSLWELPGRTTIVGNAFACVGGGYLWTRER